MLVIDENTDAHLLARLEQAQLSDTDESRYIYFHLEEGASGSVKDTIITMTHQHFTTKEGQIYFCENGDVCVMAPNITSHDGNQLISTIAEQCGRAISMDWVIFDEIKRSCGSILERVRERVQLRETTRHLQLQQRSAQLKQARRAEILQELQPQDRVDIQRRRAGRPSPKIMVIEDDAFSRKLVERTLETQYQVLGLPTADSALTLYYNLLPDVLFLDINLPDVTGHELLERIIHIDPDAYVIMLSANADNANISQAIALGAKGFVAKPFTKDKLLKYIERCPSIKARKGEN